MLTESDFNEAQQRLISAWHRGDVATALAQIDAVLRDGTPVMRGQCLFYRGMIRKSEGSLDNARQDWVEALRYARTGTFLRYELEHSLGGVYEKLNEHKEALRWYRSALKSCSSGDEFAGNRTLEAFIRLSGANISLDDNALLASVIKKSWAVLEMPGKPDLKNLETSVIALTTRFNELVAGAAADS